MNRRDQRRRVRGQRVRERLPIQVIVNQIELARARKELRDMQRGEDLAVERRVFIQSNRNDRGEFAVEARVAGCKERHVQTAPPHAVGHVERDLLPGTVTRRWGRP